MNRLLISALASFSLCPILAAQQPAQSNTVSVSELNSAAKQPGDLPQLSALAERAQVLKKARTVGIDSQTAFLSFSTMERALMLQKDWDRLGLNLINGSRADLKIEIHRVVFTHIHTYVVTDTATGIVIAAGRVRAIDGVVASGPMAEQIVKALSVGRLPARANGGE